MVPAVRLHNKGVALMNFVDALLSDRFCSEVEVFPSPTNIKYFTLTRVDIEMDSVITVGEWGHCNLKEVSTENRVDTLLTTSSVVLKAQPQRVISVTGILLEIS